MSTLSTPPPVDADSAAMNHAAEENIEEIRAELDLLKSGWHETNRRLERLEEATLSDGRRVSGGNVKSAQQRLEMMYQRFSLGALLCAGWIPLMVSRLWEVFAYPSTGYRIAVMVVVSFYFLTAAAMDFHLYRAVRAIDLGRMSVTEVAARAIKLKRRHHLFQIMLIPLAIGVLALMVWPIADTAALIGMGAGGAVGLALGLTAYRRMMRSYRTMISCL